MLETKKNIVTPLRLNKKGLILGYFLVVLNVISVLIMNYIYEVNEYVKYQEKIKEFRDFAFVEVLTIKHIKEAYLEFEEHDEILEYQSFIINIEYDDLVATFIITNLETNNTRVRTLVYDDIEEMVETYY